MTLTLAGHHQPLVLRATGEVEQIGCLGTALALFDDPELHNTTFELAPGEVLCAFTDGLVEARHGRDMFGADRVAELLRGHGDLPVDQLASVLAMLLIRSTGTPSSPASTAAASASPG